MNRRVFLAASLAMPALAFPAYSRAKCMVQRGINYRYLTPEDCPRVLGDMHSVGFYHRSTFWRPLARTGGHWKAIYQGTDREGNRREYVVCFRAHAEMWSFHRHLVHGLI